MLYLPVLWRILSLPKLPLPWTPCCKDGSKLLLQPLLLKWGGCWYHWESWCLGMWMTSATIMVMVVILLCMLWRTHNTKLNVAAEEGLKYWRYCYGPIVNFDVEFVGSWYVHLYDDIPSVLHLCHIYQSRTRACLAIHKFQLDSNEVWLSMFELRCHKHDQSKVLIEWSLHLVHVNNDHYKYCGCYWFVDSIVALRGFNKGQKVPPIVQNILLHALLSLLYVVNVKGLTIALPLNNQPDILTFPVERLVCIVDVLNSPL